jgi:uncharacterized membrane protein
MIKAAEAINSFASEAEQIDVLPSEETIFVLTASQLQGIVSKAVLEATEPLYREIAYDRQRIAKLEQREPQPLQKDRGEILRALLAANGGKMLAKEARQKMHLSKTRFSLLLNTLSDYIETKPYHLDNRRLVLFIK